MGMSRQQAIKIISQMIKDEEGFLSDHTVEAHKMAIKALEQDPFINKPCISSGVCEHDKQKALDKVRAEIIEDCGYSKDYVGAFTYSTIKLKTVLQIIDKYKAEVEPQESEEV